MIISKGPKITFAILKIATFWPVVSVLGFAAIYFGKNLARLSVADRDIVSPHQFRSYSLTAGSLF